MIASSTSASAVDGVWTTSADPVAADGLNGSDGGDGECPQPPSSPQSGVDVDLDAARPMGHAPPPAVQPCSAGFSLRIATANVCCFPLLTRNKTAVMQFGAGILTAMAMLRWTISAASNAHTRRARPLDQHRETHVRSDVSRTHSSTHSCARTVRPLVCVLSLRSHRFVRALGTAPIAAAVPAHPRTAAAQHRHSNPSSSRMGRTTRPRAVEEEGAGEEDGVGTATPSECGSTSVRAICVAV